MNEENVEELKKAVQFFKSESLRFKDLIDTAKTSYKKQFYKKKLKANNQEFAKYIFLYNHIMESKDETIITES